MAHPDRGSTTPQLDHSFALIIRKSHNSNGSGAKPAEKLLSWRKPEFTRGAGPELQCGRKRATLR